ncbi:uncharacterized protein LOC132699915 isoform X1 [Cylas formicarius]|uniref:uncharacterized protein LOC132699915 isoform X1 n=1 Tax=Cylas formicarius TaxID=197179 RepID=UPI00295873EA|nr:uncharacterized protein LOC132699915 isoform X1 [Cylas formicarius]
MHGSAGLHSAMAIKRQRRQREVAKRRAAERRLSSKTNSMDSMEHLPTKRSSFNNTESYQVTSIGLLHIGVCFLVLGLFLIGSGLLPDDLLSWKTGGWWNELTMTGIFVTVVGLFLIVLNKIVSRKEEQELQDYVRSQLTRSRSGHRLERDVETGCLTTKHHRRLLEKQREDKANGEMVSVHSPHNKNAPQNALNGDAQLEKILEEDSIERFEEVRVLELKETVSTTTTASVSPGSPTETRELIANGRQFSFNSRQY